MEKRVMANAKALNKESAEMRIKRFKEEFELQLANVQNQELEKVGSPPLSAPVDPMEYSLDANQTRAVLY